MRPRLWCLGRTFVPSGSVGNLVLHRCLSGSQRLQNKVPGTHGWARELGCQVCLPVVQKEAWGCSRSGLVQEFDVLS
jgi:hypothetical protein